MAERVRSERDLVRRRITARPSAALPKRSSATRALLGHRSQHHDRRERGEEEEEGLEALAWRRARGAGETPPRPGSSPGDQATDGS
jgi:hypothetical protein